jgi:hypothetical protein
MCKGKKGTAPYASRLADSSRSPITHKLHGADLVGAYTGYRVWTIGTWLEAEPGTYKWCGMGYLA